MNKKYEYSYVFSTFGLDNLTVKLDETGKDGWECYQVIFLDNAGLAGRYIGFLRRIKE